ncbi:hypothetical protein DFQ27_001600, partial [Actinomortierella ambigua]
LLAGENCTPALDTVSVPCIEGYFKDFKDFKDFQAFCPDNYISMSTVEQQERPLYLQPMIKDGGYVWMEKDGRSKDQQATSAPSSPNQAALTSGKKHTEDDG